MSARTFSRKDCLSSDNQTQSETREVCVITPDGAVERRATPLGAHADKPGSAEETPPGTLDRIVTLQQKDGGRSVEMTRDNRLRLEAEMRAGDTVDDPYGQIMAQLAGEFELMTSSRRTPPISKD